MPDIVFSRTDNGKNTAESERKWGIDYLHICRGKDLTPICIAFKPVKTTNADAIRSMTDEELAEWLCDIAGWLPMYEGKMHPILDWLKQEVVSDG